MTTLEKKIQKKVDEINNLISLASNSESDNAYDGNLMVTDTSSTWEEPAIYKPIVFRNGVLYIEYFEPYSNRTKKDKILKRNLEFDGYGTLLDIAKIYRRALKKENIKYAGGGEFMTDPNFGNFQNNVYADGGATENYVSRKNLNTITIKKGNQKLTYKISDVLNGAYKLESGANLEDIAFYVPKRSIIKVQLKTGQDFKPANGYWIKDGAKPIHITKFDEGGSIEKSILKITPITTKRDSKGFRFYSDNTGNKLFAEKDNKIYNVNDDLKVIGEVPLQRVRFVIEGIISDEDVKNLEPLHYEAKTIKRVREQFGLKNKYNEGGVMSRLLTRKKDQPKVETTDEDIDLNEDSRIRVKPSSFVSKDKEGDWMMKKNSSKEARSYAGGGEIRVGDKVKVKASGIGEDYAIVTGIDSLNDVLKRNDDPNTYLSIKDSKGYNWEIYLKEVVEFPSKTKLFGGGKVTFSEKAKAIAKNFEGKRVEPKYQKEYGKVYDKDEAKEVGNKIAGSQKASYDAKLEKGSEVKKKAGNPKMKATLDLAKKIRKDGEKWTDAVKRASLQLK